MKHILHTTILAAVVASSQLAAQETTVPDLSEFYEFIQTHSPVYRWNHPQVGEDRYNVTDIAPLEVHFLDQQELTDFVGGGSGEVIAVYEDGHMYLNENIDFTTNEDMSVLLHELVHHVQWSSGEHPAYENCPMHLEIDAYRIQQEWMKTVDIDAEWVAMMKLNAGFSGDVICYGDRS